MGVRQSSSSSSESGESNSSVNTKTATEIITMKPVTQRQVRALHRHQKKNLRCVYTPPPPPPSPAVSTPTTPVANLEKKQQKKKEKKQPELDQRERIQQNYGDSYSRYLTLHEKETSLCLTVTTITAEKIIETRPKNFEAPCDSDGEEDDNAGWTVLSKTDLPDRKRKTFRFERYACYYSDEDTAGGEKDLKERKKFFTQCRHMGPSDGFQVIKRWNPTRSSWEWDKETRDFETEEGLVIQIREVGDTSISQDGPSVSNRCPSLLLSADDEQTEETDCLFDGITNFEATLPKTYSPSYYDL